MTMRLAEFPLDVQVLPGAMPAFRASIDASELRGLCQEARSQKFPLIALWGSDETQQGGGYALHLALALPSGLLWLTVPLAREHPRYPGIADVYPSADRMQRAAYDLVGIHAQDNPDRRKWLRHGAWPGGVFPLRSDFSIATHFPAAEDHYPFVKVDGEGVHEIPVGPVHAGTIEPGHFRFSIVGEKILRLEERLGYKHKGIEKRFETMTLEEGAKLAGRISGDSTVAYAWAYAMAVESIVGGIELPRRAHALRGILLELERIANHLGDLGYLGNDVGLSFGFFQFWRLKEDLLRLNAQLFGHRYLMDAIVPGGVAKDLLQSEADLLLDQLQKIQKQVTTLKSIYDEHAGAQDRFIMTGRLPPELAEKIGLTGFAGRSSGNRRDLRVNYSISPYRELGVQLVSHTRGDVAARVSVRFDELAESIRLIQMLLRQLPSGGTRIALANAAHGTAGIGWVEGWRGEIFIALEAGENNRVRRCHAHDPSWQNWPALQYAVIGNIVPDFPLINKSFNLSYSGHDL
ncbi:MAG TPA: NADH-quinone oxidoreductase subunit C [Burkholderiales bacterium]|nr:NADH-quinone oxidoreductase subunit C [Burkholderiales bacterium]